MMATASPIVASGVRRRNYGRHPVAYRSVSSPVPCPIILVRRSRSVKIPTTDPSSAQMIAHPPSSRLIDSIALDERGGRRNANIVVGLHRADRILPRLARRRGFALWRRKALHWPWTVQLAWIVSPETNEEYGGDLTKSKTNSTSKRGGTGEKRNRNRESGRGKGKQ